jgi:polyisoprenoid-binding protein YceI
MKRPSTLPVLTGILCLPAFVGPAGAFTPQATASATAARPALSVGVQPGRVEFDAVGWPSALKIHGKGEGLEGRLRVEGAGVSGAIAFDLQSLSTGIALRDRHMKEKYLETARFPRATLTLSRVALEKVPATDRFGPVAVPFGGTLSLHGVEQPVTGEAKIARSGSSLTTTATFEINIKDFGIGVPSYMGITVAEKVQVRVGFPAQLEPSHDAVAR